MSDAWSAMKPGPAKRWAAAQVALLFMPWWEDSEPADDDGFAPGVDEGPDAAYDDTYDPVFDVGDTSSEEADTAGADAIAGIFLAADTLQHHPYDEDAALALLDAIDKAKGRTPFGMAPEWWDGIVRDARNLASSVPVGDAGSVTNAAHSLWERLRNYV